MNYELQHWVGQLPLAKAARDLAAHAHRDQTYGAVPYLAHLDRVAEIVTEYREAIGEDWANALAGAFLHDLIEDVPAEAHKVAATVPAEVVAVVEALTKREGLAMPDYFAGIKMAGRLAVAVKLADRIANLEACHASGAPNARKLARYRGERDLFATMRKANGLAPLWARLEAAYG